MRQSCNMGVKHNDPEKLSKEASAQRSHEKRWERSWSAIDLLFWKRLEKGNYTPPTCMGAIEGCNSSIRMESQPQVGLGKLRHPMDPLALNQVGMRLPHDGDGGRDTEKCGIGAWLM
jgi:hypothetical protein